KAFTLKHGRKPCWFDCHRRFLPDDHPFRRQRDAFQKNKIERQGLSARLSGFEILSQLREIQLAATHSGTPHRLPGFGKDHNWVRLSIFWELPYWPTLLVRHNLDVMHVEKNVFDNMFNTVMDVKGKTKDNARAREDLKTICKRPELELQCRDDKIFKPKATYVLTSDQVKEACR